MQKRILISGVAGFIGSNLCAALLRQGHEIIGVDNFSTGSRKNIERFFANPRFTFIEHDIIHPIDRVVDCIYNLACPASPSHYQRDPIQTTKTSVLGMLAMLELAKKYDARILQASTSEVYGDPAVHPQVESYFGNVNPIGIRSCYDEGKRCAESLCFDYHRVHKVRIKVARIFNTYGPNMDPFDGRVVSNFIVNALANKPLEVYGTGLQTRSFCYVDDLLEGLIRLMESDEQVRGPINMGNPSEFTVLELALLVIKLTGSSSRIIYKPLPADDPTQRRPDISRAAALLSWNPSISLEEGLQKTIQYFKKMKRDTSRSCEL